MHLLATTSGTLDDAAIAIDLKQSPGDIVILSAADSELALLARAADQMPDGFPTIRVANLMQLQHSYSVDLYAEQTLAHAKLIIVKLLGGKSYWSYGVDRLRELATERDIKLVFLPGSVDPDASLASLSNCKTDDVEDLRRHIAAGGPDNAIGFLQQAAHLLDLGPKPPPPKQFASAGQYYSSAIKQEAHIGMVFYRSVIEGGQTSPIDALITSLEAKSISVSALFVASLKDKTSANLIETTWGASQPNVIINATAFAVGDAAADPLASFNCPVLQVTFAGTSEEHWRESSAGLAAKDLAMSVVLPELDGRIYAGVVSFKADQVWHEKTQCRLVTYKPVQDRIKHVAALASNWAKLHNTKPAEKHVAIILANYPDKDGRIANGVGYDTPASTIGILQALANQGYDVEGIPADGNQLIEALQDQRHQRRGVSFDVKSYAKHFAALPEQIRIQIIAQWGLPEADPHCHNGGFPLELLCFGNITVSIQPARGYGIDPKSTYHDPALVPPHFYLATYFWLRHHFKADAIIHNGKHGNLEWLPGKSVGLSENCYPGAILGPIPQFYPFIVNDPGEGTAAKRRTSAVIIDHLTPPLTRAETYGPLKDLEALVDEYYLASGLDKRRLKLLKENILELTRFHKLDQDAGFTGEDESDLNHLDTFLCDLKESQIRDGLHVFGQSPTGQQETDLLVALTRVPRGQGEGADASLIRAIADDMELGFDPLNCAFADEWKGARPSELQEVSPDPWRTLGDTVERLELLAQSFIASFPRRRESRFCATDAEPKRDSRLRGNDGRVGEVVHYIDTSLRPTLAACGPSEIANLLSGLAGRRIAPGPSGAPTRGRLDVLPTGRNFYSIDNRTLPTPAAWNLGRVSADEVLKRHMQDHGRHLKVIGLSAWGTSNMRTGGDDLAQALWFMGAKPVWDPMSWRVTGYEILPLAAIGRPRVDVTLRISGFFRDAFPAQIELLDQVTRAVAKLEEPDSDNPLAAKAREESKLLQARGIPAADALTLSSRRIYGAKPGAYGAGLQALIDEGIWDTRADLAAAYITWGSYAYGAGTDGAADETQLKRRLASIEAVIHNQDNREHDLLDSDDYYQFEGGMSAAVETASGKKPITYHNDHSRPERPVVRTLDEEIARVVRSRVVNPKWIAGVKRHGYKGAFEIAATVDYMFAFAATADAVKSHHFDLAYDAYLVDADTRQFITDNNPAALKEIAARLSEAIARGLWQPRLNSAYDDLKALQQ
jgi:cobaltochelatase CobN